MTRPVISTVATAEASSPTPRRSATRLAPNTASTGPSSSTISASTGSATAQSPPAARPAQRSTWCAATPTAPPMKPNAANITVVAPASGRGGGAYFTVAAASCR